MNIKSKLWLDRNIFGTLVRFLNLLVVPIGKILRIDHSLDSKFKTIVICKYKGMGSIVQATPLLQAIRHAHPTSKLVFVSAKENKAILEQINGIDEIITLNDKNFISLLLNVIPFWWQLFRLRAEVYVDLEVYSNFSSLMTIFSLAKNRLGFYIMSKHYRMGNYTHMMYYNRRSPIAETYMQLARLMRCPKTDFGLDRLERAPAENFDLEKWGLSKPYLLINPNASDLRIERRWPASYFTQLIPLIQQAYPDHKIGLVGSPGEADYVNSICAPLSDITQVKVLAGKSNIAELLSLIEQADLMVTNDTGPMHVAFAKETPTVALFGPGIPSQYGLAKNVWIVYENLYCSPCIYEFVEAPCRGNNVCMQSMTPMKVFKAVQEALSGASPSDMGSIKFMVDEFAVGRFDRNND